MEVDYSKALDKIKFWKSVIEGSKEFTGTSPPSVFVGRFGYPKVYVGVLAPPVQQKAEHAAMLDSPERWYSSEASIEQILNFRGQMIYSRFVSPIKRPSGKFMETTQEVAMSRRPADVEVQLKKQPTFKMDFNSWAKPIGSPATIEKIRLTENPKIERKVDYLVSDTDMKAQDAVARLYKYGLPVSRIQKILSAGLLGIRVQRKLVPTKWSVTGVDSILSDQLTDKLKDYQELGEFRLFSNTYLGNHFEILLIPGPWRFEVIETVLPERPYQKIKFYSDWENYWGRKTYAKAVAGGYYAVRVAVTEYLDKIKRQAGCLVLREIDRQTYYAPLGVWVVRETSRGAFENNYSRFSSLDEALDKAFTRLKIKKEHWLKESRLLKELKIQKSVKSYLT